ncbi:NAF1-domain-containing protein, partial [Basidiobolus meristosporus CBS 931.73]
DYESSDLESSSGSSDSESSSEDDSMDEGTALADADCDDELGFSVSAGGLRTRHELDPPPVPEIQVEIPENAPIVPLGLISSVIDNLVVVETYISDQPQYLDAGSLLVMEDRKPLGYVFETFGPVSRPFYSVRFNQNSDIDKERIVKGKRIFSIPNMAHYVLPGAIRDKGSDASNMYDEEV